MRVHTDAHDHAAASNGPWLRCLTHQPRIGFKGRGSSDWLHGVGVSLPAAPNRWCHDASGAVVGRLGAQDFIIFDEGDGVTNLPHSLAERWQSAAPRGCYIVPRQHSLARIALDGVRAPELLARLCAVDLAPAGFAEDAIAQTQVALMSAVVLRLGDGAPAIHCSSIPRSRCTAGTCCMRWPRTWAAACAVRCRDLTPEPLENCARSGFFSTQQVA